MRACVRVASNVRAFVDAVCASGRCERVLPWLGRLMRAPPKSPPTSGLSTHAVSCSVVLLQVPIHSESSMSKWDGSAAALGGAVAILTGFLGSATAVDPQ